MGFTPSNWVRIISMVVEFTRIVPVNLISKHFYPNEVPVNVNGKFHG